MCRTASFDMCADYLRFQCSLCFGVHQVNTAPRTNVLYQRRYFTTSCCCSLVCNICTQSNIDRPNTFKCMICSIQTSICEKIKDGGHENANRWNRDSWDFNAYHSSLLDGGLILLIPFTAKKQLGTWREVGKIFFRNGVFVLYDSHYKKCIEKYNDFVNDFYVKQHLFYLFRSSNLLRKLKRSAFIRTFVPSPMLEFFDTQKCYLSLVSRKLFLKQNQFGFVILIIERLSVLNLFSFNRILHAFLYKKKLPFNINITRNGLFLY
jgi:hypothetical protein